MKVLGDFILLAGSILLAVLLTTSGAVQAAVEATADLPFLGPFLAGALYTSLFTVALGISAIAELAQQGTPPLQLSLIGALGAMIVDFIIFKILKLSVADHLLEAVRHSGSHRLKLFFRRSRTRLIGTFMGAIIIASPFPDEAGLLLMGLSRARWYVTLVLTYILNAVGIAAVAFAALRL